MDIPSLNIETATAENERDKLGRINNPDLARQLAKASRNLPRRRTEFSQILSCISEEFKKVLPDGRNTLPPGYRNIPITNYLAVRQLFQYMLPQPRKVIDNTSGKEIKIPVSMDEKKLSIDALKIFFDRVYPSLKAIEIKAEIENKDTLHIPTNIVDNALNIILGSEIAMFTDTEEKEPTEETEPAIEPELNQEVEISEPS